MGREITLTQFIDQYEGGECRILDVREAWERPFMQGEHVIKIPINQIPQFMDMIPKTEDLVVLCQHGVRSKYAIEYLESQHNFSNLINLQGGVSTYRKASE